MKKELTLRQKQHNATLEAIRSSVDKMVEEIGFEKMTIRDICAESGITVGTFYNYFSSKNDLLKDRFIRTSEHFNSLYESELEKMDEIEALKEFSREYMEFCNRRAYKIFRIYYQVKMEEYENWKKTMPDGIRTCVEQLVSKGQTNGSITNKYPQKSITTMLMSLLHGVTVEYLTDDRTVLADVTIEKMISEYIDSLRN